MNSSWDFATSCVIDKIRGLGILVSLGKNLGLQGEETLKGSPAILCDALCDLRQREAMQILLVCKGAWVLKRGREAGGWGQPGL